MKGIRTQRGFVGVWETAYLDDGNDRLIAESSAIGDNEDSLEKPGSSFLWVGADHHLNREQVAELIARMQH